MWFLKNITIPTSRKVVRNSLEMWGFKRHFLKEIMKLKIMGFLEEYRSPTKKPFIGEVWIFSGTTQ